MSYPACPLQYNGRTCQKKLSDPSGDGNWYCERCAQEAQPDWRYILSLQVDDHTGHIWLTAFQVKFLLVCIGMATLVDTIAMAFEIVHCNLPLLADSAICNLGCKADTS